jgi:hypothetical protein
VEHLVLINYLRQGGSQGQQSSSVCGGGGAGLRFPPTLHYILPDSVHRADKIVVDTQPLTQYFKVHAKWKEKYLTYTSIEDLHVTSSMTLRTVAF